MNRIVHWLAIGLVGSGLSAGLTGCGGEDSASNARPDVPELVDARQYLPNAPRGAMIHMPLSAAVARFYESKGKLPNSFDELVQEGLIKSVPEPPDGKRFYFDRSSMQVLVLPK
jgi:hypothetical protein